MSKCYASAVIKIAEAEVGYKEKETNSNLDSKTANAGDKNYTKYARDFDEKYSDWYNGKKNGYAWCDMFVDWCFLTAFGYDKALELLCQPEKSAGAGCTYSYKYYKEKGQVGTNPKIGAQIFFGTSESKLTHTGLVYKFDSSKVYTIEGNSSDQVQKCSYSLTATKIIGYGYPAYDTEVSLTGGEKTTDADPETIWNYLLGKIGNAYGVAGLMGNLYAESGLKSCNLQNTYEKKLNYTDDAYTDAVDDGSYTKFSSDSAGYGLAQWTYKTRKAALLEYCQGKKASVGNLTAQLEFLYQELSSDYKTVLSTLKSATTVKAASDIVLTKFENPASQTDAVKTKRTEYGQTYYDKYATASSSGTSSGSSESSTVKIETAKSRVSGYSKGKTLTTTAKLRMRTGAGEDKTIIKTLAKGAKVTWYGYYTTVSKVKWYLVVDSTGQDGFMCSTYLK